MWFKFGINSYSSVLELREYANTTMASLSAIEKRASVSILIIDDQKFQAFTNLTTYGYKIREVHDIHSLKEVQSYDIILCDLMGVGNSFDKSLGGASIIQEIKKNYPTKFVVAYTGARSNSTEAVAAREYADDFIKKDAEISSWVSKLDGIIEEVINPYEMWIIARQGLIDNEIDLRTIVKLEDAYVKSIKNKDKSFASIRNIIDTIDIGGTAKAIIQGLISSAIYAMVLA